MITDSAAPLGQRFNPFNPEIQAQLNEMAQMAARFQEIEPLLKRVIIKGDHWGGAAAVGIWIKLNGAELLPGEQQKWKYQWLEVEYKQGDWAEKTDGRKVQPIEQTEGYDTAFNLAERDNTQQRLGNDAHALYGIPLDPLDPCKPYILTVQPMTWTVDPVVFAQLVFNDQTEKLEPWFETINPTEVDCKECPGEGSP